MSAPFELFAPPNAWDDEFISSLERKQRKAQDKADVRRCCTPFVTPS